VRKQKSYVFFGVKGPENGVRIFYGICDMGGAAYGENSRSKKDALRKKCGLAKGDSSHYFRRVGQGRCRMVRLLRKEGTRGASKKEVGHREGGLYW